MEKDVLLDLGVMVSVLTWYRHQAQGSPAPCATPAIEPYPCTQSCPDVKWVLLAPGSPSPFRFLGTECLEAVSGGD